MPSKRPRPRRQSKQSGTPRPIRILPPSDPLPPPLVPLAPAYSPAVEELCQLLAEIVAEQLANEAKIMAEPA